MMSKEEFIKHVVEHHLVINDSQNVFINYHHMFFAVSVAYVMDRDETYPFEASDILENDLNHPAWDVLYYQYLFEVGV